MTQILSARPIFYVHKMQSHKDLMTKMFEYLGTPSTSDFEGMKVKPIPLPKHIKKKPLMSVFKDFFIRDEEVVRDLLLRIFRYNITQRFSAWEACNHKYFDLLKTKDAKLPNGNPLPDLFDFTDEERSSMPESVLKTLGSINM